MTHLVDPRMTASLKLPHVPFGLLATGVGALLALGTGGAMAGEAAPAANSAPASIPFDQLGAEAQKQYTGDGIAIIPTRDGAWLKAVMQDLEGEATSEGLWLTSTADEDAGKANRFRVRAMEVGRGKSTVNGQESTVLAVRGAVRATKESVAYIRPGLVEEYFVSTDGVRQDFVVLGRPWGYGGTLEVILDVTGARAEAAAYGAKLTVTATGRELAYSRLKVTDATGKELVARMKVDSAIRLRVEVEDGGAVYPVRIDPTFSDADWVSMGAGLQGPNDYINALLTDNDGNLYVGGAFTRIGDAPASKIAKWDGTTWSNLEGGLNGNVYTLAMVGGDVYAGGLFTMAGATPVSNIARWNGAAWSALGVGTNSSVNALAVMGTDLYAGGNFTLAGGGTANHIARWDGANWSQLDTLSLNDNVAALAVMGTDLYVGGVFSTAGGALASNVAKWNGATWSALGLGVGGPVYALAFLGGDMYAGGSFLTAGAASANRIAKWDGTSWSPLGSGASSGEVYALTVLNGNLVVGGSFITVGGLNAIGTEAGNLAMWNGTTWSRLAGAGPVGEVRALSVGPGAQLYIGGAFSNVGGVRTRRLARLNGNTWWEVGYGLNDTVRAMAVSGTDIYMGGDFTSVHGKVVNHIVRWNGAEWQIVGTGVDGTVRALAVSGGDVYAAGDFLMAGGSPANHVAMWDGSAWTPLGDGTGGAVNCLAVAGAEVYAGGTFLTAGGVASKGIAKWNGTAWSDLASGTNGTVHALSISGGNVYAGGLFTAAGGVSSSNIARWDGNGWAALGGGTNNAVHALAVSGSTVYAGGDFTSAGGVSAFRIARWNGSAWSAMGSMNAAVRVLAVSGSSVYAGGDFTLVNGIGHWGISRWNGSTWTALTDLNNGLNGSVNALAIMGSKVYAGGSFSKAKDAVACAAAVWDGTAWSSLGRSADGNVNAMVVMGSDLYIGGVFTVVGGVQMGAGGLTSGNVAKWNGSSWSYLGTGTSSGTGVNGPVLALAASNGILYVGGSFTASGPTTLNRVAKWDGSAWSALGLGVNNPVRTLAVYGTDLYAGGDFTNAGGSPAPFVARWNGTSWSPVGSPGVSAPVNALAVSGSNLFVGGNFSSAGLVSAGRIAMWNGTTWSALGAGVDGVSVNALAVSGTDLYVGGDFSTAGGVTSPSIARWNGSSWSAVGQGLSSTVRALAVSGNNLYAGGDFTVTGGGDPASRIACWDGISWSAVGSGTDDAVLALAALDADVYVGGQFATAGGKLSPYLARVNLPGVFPSVALGGAATNITTSSATVHGVVNPQGVATAAEFEYGPTTGYGSTMAVTLDPDNGLSDQPVSAVLAGLTPGVVYHYRLRANGPEGSSSSADGTFTVASANLSALVVQNCTLSPAFSSSVTSYSATTQLTTAVIRPTAASAESTITVNGVAVASGTNSAPINLPLIVTPIAIVVTALDGVTKTYTVNITRPTVHGAIAIDVPPGSTILVDESAGAVNIPIVRQGGADGQITFEVTTTDGNAKEGSDFTAPTPTQTMDDLQADANIQIGILNPTNSDEPNETFTVSIGLPITGGATLGGVTSVTVRIIDSTDTSKPSVPVITEPAAGAALPVNSLETISIKGTAKDNKGVGRVKVKLNDGTFEDAVLTTPGAANTNWSLDVTPVAGTNTITVHSVDTHHVESSMVTRAFKALRPLMVTVDESTYGSVTAGFSPSSFREVGKSYTITATPKSTPAPGGVFTGWTVSGGPTLGQIGVASSSLGKQTITFIFREGLELTANFAANPYPSLAGTYNGLIRPAGGSPRDNSTEGHFSATVQSTGAFSGKLTIDGLVLNVAGAFDKNGDARFGTARLPTLTVARPSKPSLTVALHLNVAENDPDPDVDDKITGTVTATEFKKSVVKSVSEVDSDRAFYNGTTRMVPAPYLGASNANGSFTAVLPAKDSGDLPAGFTEQDYPQGDGIATVTITKAGVVTVTGTLADGTTMTASSTLSEVGAGHASRFPMFAPLYTKKGFLSGFVTLDHTQSDSDMTAADLQWLRPFMLTHYYPYGWPEVIAVDLMGAKYAVTAGQSSLKAPDGADGDDLGDPLQAADEDGNAVLSFSDGQLSEDLQKFVNVSNGDAVTKVPDNDPTFTLAITRATGALSGSFTHTDDTVATFKGILYQKSAAAGGHGHFLTKPPTPIDYTGESGRVRLIGEP